MDWMGRKKNVNEFLSRKFKCQFYGILAESNSLFFFCEKKELWINGVRPTKGTCGPAETFCYYIDIDWLVHQILSD